MKVNAGVQTGRPRQMSKSLDFKNILVPKSILGSLGSSGSRSPVSSKSDNLGCYHYCGCCPGVQACCRRK